MTDEPGGGTVLYARDANVAWLTLNRPGVLNAIDQEMLEALGTMLDRAQSDPEVAAVVLTGAGDRAFSAGADIAFLQRAERLAVRELARLAVEVTRRIETLGKIVVASINGYALGGGLELAEACTFRVAARGARLGHPEVRIGAVAGWGGTTRLPRLVGRGRAAEMLLTGDMIDADEAARIGLVNRVVDPEHLRSEVERLAGTVTAHSAAAVRLTWEALHRGLNSTLEESALLGADFFCQVATTDGFREGTGAFLRGSPPSSGRAERSPRPWTSH